MSHNEIFKIDFDNTYLTLPQDFYKKVLPASVPNPRLVFYNSTLAKELLIPDTSIETLTQVFSGQTILEGSEPMAQTYAGHQFGHFVPQLGDGRAIHLGEVINQQTQRKDIQLKGAGLTPFSRGGDGLAPLGPMLREYIVSEAMHALGVPTTRALALTTTGTPVLREKIQKGAILTRVASSHIRVGTFEYFASRNDFKSLKILADYVIHRHYTECLKSANPYLELLKDVIHAQAQLIAKWMGLGFIHGVMNTDNMTVSGETIDYGPCAFMDFYDPKKVFSSIDRRGRYAYSNQPQIAEWNLSVFASTLLPLIADPTNQDFGSYDDFLERGELYSESNVKLVQDELDQFKIIYKFYWLQEMKQKLGLALVPFHDLNAKDKPDPVDTMSSRESHTRRDFVLSTEDKIDSDLAENFLNLLAEQKIDFTLAFRRLSQCVLSDLASIDFLKLFLHHEKLNTWTATWKTRLKSTGFTQDDCVKSMNQKNPSVIPRNHVIDKAIKQAEESDDFDVAEIALNLLTRPFEDPTEEHLAYTHPPKPEEQITKTFCGT